MIYPPFYFALLGHARAEHLTDERLASAYHQAERLTEALQAHLEKAPEDTRGALLEATMAAAEAMLRSHASTTLSAEDMRTIAARALRAAEVLADGPPKAARPAHRPAGGGVHQGWSYASSSPAAGIQGETEVIIHPKPVTPTAPQALANPGETRVAFVSGGEETADAELPPSPIQGETQVAIVTPPASAETQGEAPPPAPPARGRRGA